MASDPRRGPARFRALWRPGVRLRCAIASIPVVGRLLELWAPAIARHAWESYQLEPALPVRRNRPGAVAVCLVCGRHDFYPLRWRPTRGEVVETWWSLVGLVPGSHVPVAAYEKATGAASRAIAHRLGWHSTACRGRRECGPEGFGLPEYSEHPRIRSWHRWDASW